MKSSITYSVVSPECSQEDFPTILQAMAFRSAIAIPDAKIVANNRSPITYYYDDIQEMISDIFKSACKKFDIVIQERREFMNDGNQSYDEFNHQSNKSPHDVMEYLMSHLSPLRSFHSTYTSTMGLTYYAEIDPYTYIVIAPTVE